MEFPQPPWSSSSSSSSSNNKVFDTPLHLIGFEFQDMSPEKVTGRLLVTEKSIQMFKVLHGGVSALIAEGVASLGAYLASGLERVAGIQLTINHLRAANVGDLLSAEATPVNVGKTIQVWEVRLYKVDPSNKESRYLISSSRVTILCNMTVPAHDKDRAENLKKLFKKPAKL
ncbi:hypothetical protein NMG60_11033066 [Bertholletia excelsa]